MLQKYDVVEVKKHFKKSHVDRISLYHLCGPI